jgi:hypothetical protein
MSEDEVKLIAEVLVRLQFCGFIKFEQVLQVGNAYPALKYPMIHYAQVKAFETLTRVIKEMKEDNEQNQGTTSI